jgi:hypothetical protein
MPASALDSFYVLRQRPATGLLIAPRKRVNRIIAAEPAAVHGPQKPAAGSTTLLQRPRSGGCAARNCSTTPVACPHTGQIVS